MRLLVSVANAILFILNASSLWLYVGYGNPLVLVSLSGLGFHRSPAWGIAFALSVVCFYQIDRFAAVIASIWSLEAVREEFLANPNYRLTILDTSEIPPAVGDFRHIVAIDRALAALGHPGLSWPPFYLLRAESCAPMTALGSARAYTNSFGSSIIFVPENPADMAPIQRFLLFHEYEHVTTRGVFNQETAASTLYIACASTLSLLALVEAPWHAYVALAWGVTFTFIRRRRANIWREVLADNWAAHRMARGAERNDALFDAACNFRDQAQLSGGLTRAEADRRATYTTLWWLVSEKEEELPRLPWWFAQGPTIAILFGIGLVAFGRSIPEPHTEGLATMAIAASVAAAARHACYRRLDRANATVQERLRML